MVYVSLFLLWFWSPCLTGVSAQLCAHTLPGNCMLDFHIAISNCRLIHLIDMHNLGNSECKLGRQLWQSDIDVWLQNYRVRAPQKFCEAAQKCWAGEVSVIIQKCLKDKSWREWGHKSTCTGKSGWGLPELK